MSNLQHDNKPIIDPNKINYDIPMEYRKIFSNEDGHIIACSKILINWIDIQGVESFPDEWEEAFDWKQYRGEDKTYINLHNGQHIIILVKFEDIAPLWIYYCKHVRKVDGFQYPDMIRSRNK